MLLEVEADLARRPPQGFRPAMIEIRPAVEHHGGDTSVLAALGDQLAHSARSILVGAGAQRGLEILVERRGSSERTARRIVDDLRVDMFAGAEDRQTRTATG